VFEIERLEITQHIHTVTPDRARRTLESRDRLRTCAIVLSSSLSARYLSFNLLLLCVVALYRCKLNCLIENPLSCEICALIGIWNGKNLIEAEILGHLCSDYWPIITSRAVC
jgi:hypothetical protein